MISTLHKNIVITGANSDIGTELVQHAKLKEDTKILAVSRSPVTISTNDGENISRLGGIDLTKAGDLSELVAAAYRNFTEPFSVVHCVGDFWLHKPFAETPFDEVQRLMKSHYLTFCGVTQALVPIMLKYGGGRFVAFSCNSVVYNYPDMAPFTSAKAAVECFVKCFAHEYAGNFVSAFALALPTIRTAKVLQSKPKGDHDNYIRSTEVAEFITSHILTLPHETTGTVIKLIRHSPTFYHSSYYERNPIHSATQIS